jgi:hypothetical protein
MLKIQRVANGEVIFTLSGRMDAENVTPTSFFCQHIRDAKRRSET